MANENMNIQWYPGHMTKTRRQIEADLKQVDAVCDIVDARIPMSSRNPDIDAICSNKPRIVVLNRSDLADPEATKRWISWFKARGFAAIATDCKSRKGISNFYPAVRSVLQERLKIVPASPEANSGSRWKTVFCCWTRPAFCGPNLKIPMWE